MRDEPSALHEETPGAEVASNGSHQSSSGRWAGRESLLSKVALELFIVFVGVSAAFAVDDYRSAREQYQRRQAIYQALDHELAQMAQTRGPALQREMTQELASWDAAIARGERPMPMETLPFEIGETAHALRKAYDRRAVGLGVTRAQWKVLFRLTRQPGLRQIELADMQVTPDSAF